MIRRAGKEAVLGVRRGARLGPIKIRSDYAAPTRRLAKKWIDPGLSARAKKGVPIGAGRVGLVRTKLPRRGGPGDRDLDGIPNGIDVDDDGDLILDGYDRPATASTSADLSQGAHLSSFPDGTSLHLTTMLGWTPYGAVNVNGGSTDEQLAAVQRDGGVLGIEWEWDRSGFRGTRLWGPQLLLTRWYRAVARNQSAAGPERPSRRPAAVPVVLRRGQ